MTNLYPNFNFLKARCDSCGKDILTDFDLRRLSQQIVFECNDLHHGDTRILSYAFECKTCKKIIKRNLSIERVYNVLIID